MPLVCRQAVLTVCLQRQEPAALPNCQCLEMLMEKHGMNVNPSKQSLVGLCRVHMCHLGIWEGGSKWCQWSHESWEKRANAKQHNHDSCMQRLLLNARSQSILLTSWDLFLPWERKIEFSSIIPSAPQQALFESPAEQIVTLK